MRLILAPVAFLALLAGCGKEDHEPGPGGVTMGEARALDEAAAMVEGQRLPAELVQPPANGPTANGPTSSQPPANAPPASPAAAAEN